MSDSSNNSGNSGDGGAKAAGPGDFTFAPQTQMHPGIVDKRPTAGRWEEASPVVGAPAQSGRDQFPVPDPAPVDSDPRNPPCKDGYVYSRYYNACVHKPTIGGATLHEPPPPRCPPGYQTVRVAPGEYTCELGEVPGGPGRARVPFPGGVVGQTPPSPFFAARRRFGG